MSFKSHSAALGQSGFYFPFVAMTERKLMCQPIVELDDLWLKFDG